MSDHDIQMLALGVAFGSYLTVLLLIALEYVTDRRAVRRAERLGTRAQVTGSTVRADLRQAEPHPAEVLEASVRDFELELRDGLDRVEDAARRNGLQ